MTYSQLYTQKGFRIPTPLAIVVVVASILLMGQYLFTGGIPFLRAQTPQVEGMMVTNRSPSGATIFWQTKDPAAGWVLWGTSPTTLTAIALDDRDSQNKRGSYRTHHVTLKTLDPNGTYFYKLVVGNQLVGGVSGSPFELRTLDKNAKISRLEPAYGKLLQANNVPLEAAVVLLQIGNAAPLSTLSKGTGEWLIPLNYVVESPSGTLKVVTATDVIKITVRGEGGDLSQITTDLAHLSPLPAIVIVNKNYDFTKEDNVLAAVATPRPPSPTIRPPSPTKAPPTPTPRRLLAQAVISPTLTPTATTTPSPSPTQALVATAVPAAPVSGAAIAPFALLSLALLTLGAGLLLAIAL